MAVRRIKAVQRFGPAKRSIRGIPYGAQLPVVDNSGAKIVEVISVIGYKPCRCRYPQAMIGDMTVVTVKKGTPEMRKKVVRAIIVKMRQKSARPDGTVIHFEDNGAVVVDEDGNPKGTEIKSAIARESAERWPAIAKIAKVVV